MPHSHPDAQTLLGVAVDHLEGEVYPTPQGALRYRTRIALNVLRIVQRELVLGAGFDAEDAAELQALLGPHAAASVGVGGAEAMARRLEHGEAALDDPQLVQFLRRSLGRALAINNPRWTRSDTSSKDTP